MRKTGFEDEQEWVTAIAKPITSWQDDAPRVHSLRSEKKPFPWGYVVGIVAMASAVAALYLTFAK